MANIIQIKDGVVTSVYDDRFTPIFEALGIAQIKRASEVEFNHSTKEWEATLVKDGRIISSGPNRNDVITAEVEWLEGNLPYVTDRI